MVEVYKKRVKPQMGILHSNENIWTTTTCGAAESRRERSQELHMPREESKPLWGQKGVRYRHWKILSQRFSRFALYTNHYVRQCDACITIRQEDHTGDNKGNSSKHQREGTSYDRERDERSHIAIRTWMSRRVRGDSESFWRRHHFFSSVFFSLL